MINQHSPATGQLKILTGRGMQWKDESDIQRSMMFVPFYGNCKFQYICKDSKCIVYTELVDYLHTLSSEGKQVLAFDEAFIKLL